MRRPFQPFTLGMNDGREIYLPHPEFGAVSRRIVMVIDEKTQAGMWLEPVLVASLQPDN